MISPMLRKAAVREALRKAFTRDYFNICGISEAYAVLFPASEGNPYFVTHPARAVLVAFHCVNWTNIGQGERRELLSICAQVLGFTAQEAEGEMTVLDSLPIAVVPAPVSMGSGQRLLQA
jgi:hypothetical protein